MQAEILIEHDDIYTQNTNAHQKIEITKKNLIHTLIQIAYYFRFKKKQEEEETTEHDDGYLNFTIIIY